MILSSGSLALYFNRGQVAQTRMTPFPVVVHLNLVVLKTCLAARCGATWGFERQARVLSALASFSNGLSLRLISCTLHIGVNSRSGRAIPGFSGTHARAS